MPTAGKLAAIDLFIYPFCIASFKLYKINKSILEDLLGHKTSRVTIITTPLSKDHAMGFVFRRSKKVGLFNFTISKSGIGASIGAGPFRFSRGGSGRKIATIRTPLRGLSYRKNVK